MSFYLWHWLYLNNIYSPSITIRKNKKSVDDLLICFCLLRNSTTKLLQKWNQNVIFDLCYLMSRIDLCIRFHRYGICLNLTSYFLKGINSKIFHSGLNVSQLSLKKIIFPLNFHPYISKLNQMISSIITARNKRKKERKSHPTKLTLKFLWKKFVI